jgi:hypothetical protein
MKHHKEKWTGTDRTKYRTRPSIHIFTKQLSKWQDQSKFKGKISKWYSNQICPVVVQFLKDRWPPFFVMHLYDCALVEVVHHAGGDTILETILVEIIQINRQNYRNSRNQKTRPSIYTKEPSKLQDQSKFQGEKSKWNARLSKSFVTHSMTMGLTRYDSWEFLLKRNR